MDGLAAGLSCTGMTSSAHLCYQESIVCNLTALWVRRSVSLESPTTVTKILSGPMERIYFTAQAGRLHSLESLC